MSFFSNKHVITAMIVAPILAVLSYTLVDSMVKEQPHKAQVGASYPLVAQSNCRYTSGQCDLKNEDFLAWVKVASDPAGKTLIVKSEHPLTAVHVGFAREGDVQTVAPTLMQSQDQGITWSLAAPMTFDEHTQMMIVMQANQVKYYAETVMTFSEYQTGFNKSF